MLAHLRDADAPLLPPVAATPLSSSLASLAGGSRGSIEEAASDDADADE